MHSNFIFNYTYHTINHLLNLHINSLYFLWKSQTKLSGCCHHLYFVGRGWMYSCSNFPANFNLSDHIGLVTFPSCLQPKFSLPFMQGFCQRCYIFLKHLLHAFIKLLGVVVGKVCLGKQPLIEFQVRKNMVWGFCIPYPLLGNIEYEPGELLIKT